MLQLIRMILISVLAGVAAALVVWFTAELVDRRRRAREAVAAAKAAEAEQAAKAEEAAEEEQE